MGDPVSDMFARILNAKASGKPGLDVPFSQLKYEIAKLLKREGFLKEAEQRGRKGKKMLELALKYQGKASAISGLKRISKPGQRIYSSSQDLLKTRRQGGTLLVSTSKGMMTDREARKQKLGGEVIGEVY